MAKIIKEDVSCINVGVFRKDVVYLKILIIETDNKEIEVIKYNISEDEYNKLI